VRVVTKMDQREWLMCHILAFEFFGGAPIRIVPDNLKTGILKADLYDPQFNPGYAELAHHYGAIIDPARSGKPKDYPEVLVIPKNLDIVRIFNKSSANLRDNIYFRPQSFNIMFSLSFHIGGTPLTSFSFGTAFSRAAFNIGISADA
jgi:hypothetical protein